MSVWNDPGSGCSCGRLAENWRSSAKPLNDPFTMSEIMLAASWTLSSGPARVRNLIESFHCRWKRLVAARRAAGHQPANHL
jgi:hypothetical protein